MKSSVVRRWRLFTTGVWWARQRFGLRQSSGAVGQNRGKSARGLAQSKAQSKTPLLLLSALLVVLLHPSSLSLAETIRVVTWNLQAKAATVSIADTTDMPATADATALIEAAAGTLKPLQPDVIVLQGVRDAQMCSELAQALKPAEYTVAVFSSFRGAAVADPGATELAILTRHKAYFSSSDQWRGPEGVKLPGGYAFATLEIGQRHVGVFSAHVGEPQMPALEAQQILDQIDTVKRWETNQVQAYIMGLNFNLLSKSPATQKNKLFRFLRTAGLDDVFANADLPSPAERPAADGRQPDFILIDAAGFALHPAVLTNSFSDHRPVTCDVELDPSRVATARAALAELAGVEESAPVNPPVTNPPPPGASWPSLAQALPHWRLPNATPWLGAGFAAFGCLVAFIWLLGRRRGARPRRTPTLLAQASGAEPRPVSSAYTVVVAPPHSVTGSIADPQKPPHTQPVIQIEAPPTTQTQSASWQQRAMAAEEEARRAQELLRQGLVSQLSQWMKQKLVRKLLVDRAELLEAHQEAARKALKVDERLNRIEQQIQQQNQAYERRIEELNRQLLAAKEENRELIRARIAQVKAEMEAARARLLAQQ